MRWTFGVTYAAALLGIAPSSMAADSSVYRDPETGFTFSTYYAMYSLGSGITFRVAVPSGVSSQTAYDVVLQIIAPNQVGWAGLAWGGKMTNNPLTVAWANGNSAIVSSRYATQHVAPTAYTGATYQTLRTGTRTNGTHWQLTAKCTGCTSFPSTTAGRTTYLNPNGSNRMAFAYAASRPSSPSSNTSSFPVHDVTNYWTHDFATAANSDFASLVTKNS